MSDPLSSEVFYDGLADVVFRLRGIEELIDESLSRKRLVFNAAALILAHTVEQKSYGNQGAENDAFQADRAFRLASHLADRVWGLPQEPRAMCPDSDEVGAPDVPHGPDGDVVDLSDAADPRNPLGDE